MEAAVIDEGIPQTQENNEIWVTGDQGAVWIYHSDIIILLLLLLILYWALIIRGKEEDEQQG